MELWLRGGRSPPPVLIMVGQLGSSERGWVARGDDLAVKEVAFLGVEHGGPIRVGDGVRVLRASGGEQPCVTPLIPHAAARGR